MRFVVLSNLTFQKCHHPFLLWCVQSGLALSLRNTANLAVIMSVTGLVTKLGSIHLAAHEIIRQVYIFSLQSFSSFDIAAQTLIASYLGRVSL